MSSTAAKGSNARRLAGAVAVLVVISACGGGDTEEPPATGGPEPEDSGVRNDQLELGQSVFAQNCASCHGERGGGGFGPKLADGRVVNRYPQVDDHREIVVEGRGQMPAWGDELSDEDIDAVVRYEREGL